MLRNFQFPIIKKKKKRVYEHEDEGEELRRCATMRERERERDLGILQILESLRKGNLTHCEILVFFLIYMAVKLAIYGIENYFLLFYLTCQIFPSKK